MNTKKKRKAIVLSLGLAAMTLTANNLAAQNGGGLFGRGMISDDAVFSTRGLINENSSNGDGFTNGYFGQDDPNPATTPLGSGLAIMLAAGLGYVALKKKEDKQ